jgi:hypothetical protein
VLKKKTSPKKLVSLAADHLHGARSGKRFGKRLNIAQINAELNGKF